MKKAIFGPAGSEANFIKQYKSSIFMPEYLSKMGLDAFEYQCGRGVNICEDTAKALGEKAKEYDITLSVHSPYYINLSSDEEIRRTKNIDYILETCKAASFMGAERIVVHCGGLSGRTREEAMTNTLSNISTALSAMDESGYSDIRLCIETMGKVNVMGDLQEVIHICRSDDRRIPCIDFGHLNARTAGGVDDTDTFNSVLDELINGLGYERAAAMHVHFSRIEYTLKGEVRHLIFDDD
ncbi:MAG: TIM barrel protein, partial [Oscillospiraceae bacterium]|nr:TIM barrel protein [Oscillospiraceae bacterium]